MMSIMTDLVQPIVIVVGMAGSMCAFLFIGVNTVNQFRSRVRLEREAAAHIIDVQQALIRRSLEVGSVSDSVTTSGSLTANEARARGFRSTQGERSDDLAEDPHDEAFQAAWINPAQKVIDKIDRELGIHPTCILDDAPAPTPIQRATGYRPGGPVRRPADPREGLQVGEVRNGWRLEADGSLTQVNTPIVVDGRIVHAEA